FLAVGRRPIVVAAGSVRTYAARALVGIDLRPFGIDLEVLALIVLDGLAGLGIDALRPGHVLDVLHRLDELPAAAIEGVIEAVATGMRDDLAVLAVHLGVDQDVGAGLVIVAVVIRRVLVPPRDLAVRRIECDRARRIEIVAGPALRIVARHRIAGAPIGQIGLWIVGAGDIEGAAAGLPGVVLVLPGLVPRFARSGNGISPPQHVAGPGIERGNPVARSTIATGGADDDFVLERQRRSGDEHLRAVAQVLVPHDLAGVLVGRDHACVDGGDRDNEIVPERNAAIAVEL